MSKYVNFLMAKKRHKKNNHHPIFKARRTFSQRASDKLTRFVGSWTFIISLLILLAIWMGLNASVLIFHWDPYPFILLNFVLSCLATIQIPIILMSQNREQERDRINFKYDYTVNRKAEREISNMQRDLNEIKTLIKNKKR